MSLPFTYASLRPFCSGHRSDRQISPGLIFLSTLLTVWLWAFCALAQADLQLKSPCEGSWIGHWTPAVGARPHLCECAFGERRFSIKSEVKLTRKKVSTQCSQVCAQAVSPQCNLQASSVYTSDITYPKTRKDQVSDELRPSC